MVAEGSPLSNLTQTGFAQQINKNPQLLASALLGGATGGPVGALSSVLSPLILSRLAGKPGKEKGKGNGEELDISIQKLFEQASGQTAGREEIFADRPLTLSELSRQASTRPNLGLLSGEPLTIGSLRGSR